MASEEECSSETESYVISDGILFFILLLLLSMMGGYILRQKECKYLHEAGLATMIGFCFGGLLNLLGQGSVFAPLTQLNVEFFLLFLLPPIIFEAGLSMDQKPFFNNFGAILLYAFSGTLISAVVVGSLIYAIGGIFASVPGLSLSESFAFGALISATDPVSVLAIMKDMGTDKRLFNLVFGESIFNDAVTIVLYRTIMTFAEQGASMKTFASATGFFIIIFLGSFVIGVLVAFLASIILKKMDQYAPDNQQQLEVFVIIICPWVSYLMSEALTLSGIVSILFCGIFMAKYSLPNLTPSSAASVGHAYEVVAHASETLIFVFVGMGVFSFNLQFERMGVALFFWMLFAVFFARGANILLNSACINYFIDDPVSPKFQFISWFSGLRGAIAFALAIDSTYQFYNGDIILAMTLLYAIITIILIGGAIAPLLIYLDVMEKPPGESAAELEEASLPPLKQPRRQSHFFKSIKHFIRNTDQKYLTPALVKPQERTEYSEVQIQEPGFSLSEEVSEDISDEEIEEEVKEENKEETNEEIGEAPVSSAKD